MFAGLQCHPLGTARPSCCAPAARRTPPPRPSSRRARHILRPHILHLRTPAAVRRHHQGPRRELRNRVRQIPSVTGGGWRRWRRTKSTWPIFCMAPAWKAARHAALCLFSRPCSGCLFRLSLCCCPDGNQLAMCRPQLMLCEGGLRIGRRCPQSHLFSPDPSHSFLLPPAMSRTPKMMFLSKPKPAC
jgi:hypothetical protein